MAAGSTSSARSPTTGESPPPRPAGPSGPASPGGHPAPSAWPSRTRRPDRPGPRPLAPGTGPGANGLRRAWRLGVLPAQQPAGNLAGGTRHPLRGGLLQDDRRDSRRLAGEAAQLRRGPDRLGRRADLGQAGPPVTGADQVADDKPDHRLHRRPAYISRISGYRLMSGSDWTMAASTTAMSAALISLPIISFLLCPVRMRGRPGMPPTAVRPPDGHRSYRHLQRLDLIGCEVQEAAMTALQVGGRVVLRGDREVDVAVDVEKHGLDQGAAAGQEQV